MYYLQNMLTLGLGPITIKCYVANKGTETDSESYQLIGTLRETISLLKDEIRNKQVTINSLIDVIKSFTPVDTRRRVSTWTVNESKHTRNKVKETNVCSKENNDVVGELLEIDELHHRFQKWIDQAQSSTDTPITSINVNQERIK